MILQQYQSMILFPHHRLLKDISFNLKMTLLLLNLYEFYPCRKNFVVKSVRLNK